MILGGVPDALTPTQSDALRELERETGDGLRRQAGTPIALERSQSMLKGIPSIISPDLLKILMEMGHGDEIVLADGNFPAASLAQRLSRSDGIQVPELLEAVLQLLPLDPYVEHAAALMAVVPGDSSKPTIWERYREIIQRHEKFSDFEYVERFAFYERAKQAYAVVATSETAVYANIILKKGLVKE
jgi:L-fucose mutarotase